MIVCGISGGVDSSVAARLMINNGHEVQGVFMRNWVENDPQCRAEQDRLDAVRVCAKLGIEFRIMDFSRTYREQVFQALVDGYARGITPNPDILCNREVKFGAFLDKVIASGAQGLATGHYARREFRAGKAVLLRAIDTSKDQSYFLSQVSSQALEYVHFPLGVLSKSQVREIARREGMVTAEKKDSTGICFIGERDFKEFLSNYLPAQQGEILDQAGRKIGHHPGALYYTVGQRAPVGGVKNGPSGPWFIVAKDVATNTLVAVPGHDHPSLLSTRAGTGKAHWIAGDPPSTRFDCQVQLRHLGKAYPASVCVRDGGEVEIDFHEPVRAVAPGQQAVFYLNELCLGGAELLG